MTLGKPMAHPRRIVCRASNHEVKAVDCMGYCSKCAIGHAKEEWPHYRIVLFREGKRQDESGQQELSL
jgi:hypothetical protein